MRSLDSASVGAFRSTGTDCVARYGGYRETSRSLDVTEVYRPRIGGRGLLACWLAVQRMVGMDVAFVADGTI